MPSNTYAGERYHNIAISMLYPSRVRVSCIFDLDICNMLVIDEFA